MPMNATAIAAVFLAVLLLPGCASTGKSSEAEWQRAQCGQINDQIAREKCLRGVERGY
jgi:outer membrane murein-binding lipoprotein Lpp